MKAENVKTIIDNYIREGKQTQDVFTIYKIRKVLKVPSVHWREVQRRVKEHVSSGNVRIIGREFFNKRNSSCSVYKILNTTTDIRKSLTDYTNDELIAELKRRLVA